jgi:fatty-acyl-CoA synthase
MTKQGNLDTAETLLASALDGGSMGELLVDALERFGDRPAFIDDGLTTTYDELKAKISRAIQFLASLGLKKGDVVAQLSDNRTDVFAIVAAGYISGLSSVSLHGMGSLDDQAYILADAEAKVLIVSPGYASHAVQLGSRLGGALRCYAHGAADGLVDFWAECAGAAVEPLRPVGVGSDIVRLAYTGGTTGAPKGVMLSNRSLVTNLILFMSGMEWPDHVRYLCPTPISHGGGSLILPTLCRGGAFMLHRGFDPGRFIDAVENEGVNMCFLVPTMLYSLLDYPRTRTADFSGLHSLLYGAAPMNPARLREALDLFGPVLVQSYGQTESPNSILTLTRNDHLGGGNARLASAGKPYAGISVRILDDDDKEVDRGEVGELCVRGPLVMSGYWRQPELTAEALRSGWLHTGDMARQDDEGYFYLVDRKKDMIISGGFNVYPGEVERVIASHPSVAAVGVIGVPDPKWGEAVKAVVVVKAGRSVDAHELQALVRDKKGATNVPKSVDFVEKLPVTGLGKPDKKALRQLYWGSETRNVS